RAWLSGACGHDVVFALWSRRTAARHRDEAQCRGEQGDGAAGGPETPRDRDGADQGDDAGADHRLYAEPSDTLGADRAAHRLAELMGMGMSDRRNIEARIAYDDLREWLARAELLGEVRNVKGASWQEDIGLAAEAILRAENGPCVVFDEVPGSPKGFR